MLSRAAISFNAEATSSACARPSSWHGPAMIEIGKSLPKRTDPAVTTGAAEGLAFNALSLHAGGTGTADRLAAERLHWGRRVRERGRPLRVRRTSRST